MQNSCIACGKLKIMFSGLRKAEPFVLLLLKLNRRLVLKIKLNSNIHIIYIISCHIVQYSVVIFATYITANRC